MGVCVQTYGDVAVCIDRERLRGRGPGRWRRGHHAATGIDA